MKPGQLVTSTQKSYDNGVFKTQQYGRVVSRDLGPYVNVLRLNQHTVIRYHEDFWEPWNGCLEE